MKRTTISLSAVLAAAVLFTSCSLQGSSVFPRRAASGAASGSSSQSSSSAPAEPQNKDILTTSDYLVNEEIPVGNNDDIIVKEGVFKQDIKEFEGRSFYNCDVDFLGVDKDYNFIIDDYDNGEIVKVDAKTNKVTTLLDYMGDRKNRMYVMNLNGDLVAWSECPNGDEDPINDPTNGAGWALYLANLKTKQTARAFWTATCLSGLTGRIITTSRDRKSVV